MLNIVKCSMVFLLIISGPLSVFGQEDQQDKGEIIVQDITGNELDGEHNDSGCHNGMKLKESAGRRV